VTEQIEVTEIDPFDSVVTAPFVVAEEAALAWLEVIEGIAGHARTSFMGPTGASGASAATSSSTSA
jgi:hypothetical protein